MSLADFAKKKALNFIESGYRQADPAINTGTGSAVRATVIIPSALIYSAIFQDVEVLRNLFLGNYSAISEQDMDLLAGLEERPKGSRSSTTLRIYLEDLEAFSLDSFPYFESIAGAPFRPVRKMNFDVVDILEEGGEIYVNVPVISTIFGPESEAAAGEITLYSNLPINVRRITNISDTQGGRARYSNSEFFNYLKNAKNDKTLNQIGGIRQYITDNYPEVQEVLVVPAGNDYMIRDEVWTADGINPNLSRDGEPFAAHTSIGTLNFDVQYGRAVATGSPFTASDVGKRVAVTGDLESFRVITQYIDANTIVLSGFSQEGQATAKIYGDGPQIQVMADIYLYFPTIQIQSTVIDKRYFLVTTNNQAAGASKIYYAVSEGYSYAALPSSGRLVFQEGTSEETVFNITGTGTDVTGDYMTLESVTTAAITPNNTLSFYDMGTIEIGTDILDRPVLYVLQIDQLDPLSFETVGTIPRSTPGTYDQPGWYISNTDPAEVFSAREQKTIILDEKADNNAYGNLNITGCNITDSVVVIDGSVTTTSGSNVISKTIDWNNTEGREILVTAPDKTLDDDTGGVVGAAVSAGAGTSTLTITGLDIEYATLVGFRDDIRVLVYATGPSLIGTYDIGEVMAYGDQLELKTGTFGGTAATATVILPDLYTNTQLLAAGPAIDDIAWAPADDDFFPEAIADAPVFYQWDGASWVDQTATVDANPFIRSQEIETVILSTNGTSTIEVLLASGLPIYKNAGGLVNTLVTVSATGDAGNFNSNPARVIYATQASFGEFQTTLDGGDIQLLCKDTLVRAFLPSLIDATIPYSGDSSSKEVFGRFIDLLQEASTEVENGSRIRLDISNIVAALDEEGLTDSIDVNFEIRVTNFLGDGEFEVRYLNPSEDTKQALAINTTTSLGADRITLRRLKSTALIPGRGKLFLGGNDPDTQELIPYEAVIDNGDNTYTFLFRGMQVTAFAHTAWETALVTVRDYDPEMEFVEGAIFIPATNRPYVRQLVVIKE